MRQLLALLGLLLICLQAGPVLAAVTYSTNGQLVGLNSTGTSVLYSIAAGKVLHVRQVIVQPSVQGLGQFSGSSWQANNFSTVGVAKINGFVVATWAAGAGDILSAGNNLTAYGYGDSSVGRLDLDLVGPQDINFIVNAGYTASLIGYLSDPTTEYSGVAAAAAPTPTPTPTPVPTPTPTPVPTPTPAPTAVPDATAAAGYYAGLDYDQATKLALAFDPLTNYALLLVALVTMFRLGWKAVKLWI